MAEHSLITVGTSSSVQVTPSSVIHSGYDITLQNVNLIGYIYIGADSSVSASNYGFRLSPGHSWSVELNGQDHIHVIGSMNDLELAVFKLSLEVGA